MNTRELQEPYSMCVRCIHEGICIHELRANMDRYFYVGECVHYLPEQQNGKWEKDEVESEKHTESIYICSACRNFEAWGETEKYNYCPNCGAKMDGD